MQKRSLIGFLLALLFFSCSIRDGKEFAAPEVLSSDAIVEGAEGELRCTLSHGRVDHCGFILDGEIVEGVLADNIFTAKLSGLEMNHTYNWEAFARAGNSEVRSSGQSFTAPDGKQRSAFFGSEFYRPGGCCPHFGSRVQGLSSQKL